VHLQTINGVNNILIGVMEIKRHERDKSPVCLSAILFGVLRVVWLSGGEQRRVLFTSGHFSLLFLFLISEAYMVKQTTYRNHNSRPRLSTRKEEEHKSAENHPNHVKTNPNRDQRITYERLTVEPRNLRSISTFKPRVGWVRSRWTTNDLGVQLH
jgi:hypothetical protein